MGPDDSAGPTVDTLCGDVLWVDRLHGLSTACHALDGLTYQPLESEQRRGLRLLLELTENKPAGAGSGITALLDIVIVGNKLWVFFFSGVLFAENFNVTQR